MRYNMDKFYSLIIIWLNLFNQLLKMIYYFRQEFPHKIRYKF